MRRVGRFDLQIERLAKHAALPELLAVNPRSPRQTGFVFSQQGEAEGAPSDAMSWWQGRVRAAL